MISTIISAIASVLWIILGTSQLYVWGRKMDDKPWSVRIWMVLLYALVCLIWAFVLFVDIVQLFHLEVIWLNRLLITLGIE